MKREHHMHKIKDAITWNRTIPVGTVVVAHEGLIAKTISSAYAVRRCGTLVVVVHVGRLGAVPIAKVRIPSDLGGALVDRRFNAI